MRPPSQQNLLSRNGAVPPPSGFDIAKALFSLALLALGASFFSLSASAQGGPPMLTDDPGTVDYKHWEINTALTIEKSQSSTEFEAPLVDINYGLKPGVQLKLEVPLLVVKDRGLPAKASSGAF